MVDSSERRDFRRMNVGVKASFKFSGEDKLHDGTVVDLSASGILLATTMVIRNGDELEVSLEPEMAVVPPLSARVKVLRVMHDVDRQYRAGCKIIELLS